VQSKADRTSPKVEPINSKAVRMRASEAVRKWIAVVVRPVRRIVAAPSAAWTAVEARLVISATEAVPAGRACHPVAGVAAAAVGGRHENILVINTGRFKGEENDASRNK
jgi:hypothetical protein